MSHRRVAVTPGVRVREWRGRHKNEMAEEQKLKTERPEMERDRNQRDRRKGSRRNRQREKTVEEMGA